VALTVYEHQRIIPAEDVRPALRRVLQIPVDQLHLAATLIGPQGQEIPLPPVLVSVLQAAARLLLQV
jgi:hypothetical protein